MFIANTPGFARAVVFRRIVCRGQSHLYRTGTAGANAHARFSLSRQWNDRIILRRSRRPGTNSAAGFLGWTLDLKRGWRGQPVIMEEPKVYLLFCSPALNPSNNAPELRAVIPLRFNTMGEAITAACDAIKNGDRVWRIESASGFVMESADIEIEYSRRMEFAKTAGIKCPPLYATVPQKF